MMEKKRKYKLGKKGSLLDFFYIPVILFITAIFIIVGYILISKSIGSGLFDSDAQSKSNATQSQNAILLADTLMLFVIVGLSAFTVISGFLSTNHPAFFFFSVFILAIAVLVSAAISNSYETFESVNGVNTYTGAFPKIHFLMDKLPIYLTFMGFLTSISMYAGYTRYG